MLKKLGKSITIVNAVAFIVVILVGGVSIYLTKNILHSAYKIEALSEDIIKVDNMHADAYRLVLGMHHFLLEEDDDPAYLTSVLKDLEDEINDYLNEELDELSEGPNLEIKLLQDLLVNVNELKAVSDLAEVYVKTGRFDKDKLYSLEEYAYEIEEVTSEINKVHMKKIGRWTNESLRNMWMIFFIYLVFILIGGLSIYAGHIILLSRVVKPIKELAAATIEFADGKLDKRVYTDAKTEIGQLYTSFNRMAEKIQENDELLRKFNEELENKVSERTSDLRDANEQLKLTQAALVRTEKIAAVGQIAAGVTHEIKNPLNSLSINAQMLMKALSKELDSESSVHETATHIKYEINRINNILEEFVKFAKFPEPQFYVNDINQVIQEVVNIVDENAKELGVTIHTSLQNDIQPFNFDARQFKEILMNLFQNALKALKNGGSLGVETTMSAGNLTIRVTDNGEGIPEKNLDNIFSPFFSTREGGMGLGLSIVQKIVESHGGKITCMSEAGKGTTFKITMSLERS